MKFDNHLYVVSAFFLVLLLIGLSIFDDYGVSWDEKIQRHHGLVSFGYVFKGSKDLVDYPYRYYGVIFQMPLIIIEKLLGLEDSRDIYLLRHLATFILFYAGLIFFYKTCKKIFGDWKKGLLACLFMVISPRIFAHSFYNPKDIPFMSFYIISLFTLIRFLEDKSIKRSLAHALACAMLIGMRIAGVVVPAITLAFYLTDAIIKNKTEITKKTLRSLASYTIFLTVSTILLWPTLWENPIQNFKESFKVMSNYQHKDWIAYADDSDQPSSLTWHYLPRWIIMTTPIIYTLLFLAGLINSIKIVFSPKDYSKNKDYLIVVSFFIVPLTGVIALKANLYDGWRHMFFIYPAFLIVSIDGFESMLHQIKSRLKGGFRALFYYSLILVVGLSLVSTSYFMVESHPHQYVYSNLLVGDKSNGYEYLIEWNLAYRDALEHVLRVDERQEIKIYVDTPAGVYNAMILEKAGRDRIQFSGIEEADYYLMWFKRKEGLREEYSKEVGGMKIMVVYEP